MLIKRYFRTAILLLIAIIGIYPLFAQEMATPKSGEGITAFLRRHGRVGSEYQKEFIALNKGKLGRNNTLKLGVKYTLPSKKQTTTKSKNHEPIFGSKLASYEVTSSELKGGVFYLVGGHGGPDPGATGRVDGRVIHEDEYAYDIMLRLARNLLMRGAKVHIIIQDAKDGIRDGRILANSDRETCMGSPIPLNHVQRLQQRCDKINMLYRQDKESYKRAIFIHIDSRPISHQVDVFFYHTKSQASTNLAQRMRSTFAGKYNRHQPQRGFTGTIGERNLYVLNKAIPPALYVEVGNMHNALDRKRIVDYNNRQALANWMCEAFITDFKQSTKKR